MAARTNNPQNKNSIAYLSKNKGRNPILDTSPESQTWNKCTDIMHTQKYRDKIHMLIDKIFNFNPQWNLIFLALIFQTLIDKISFTSVRYLHAVYHTIFCRFTIGVTGEISLSHECASYRQKAMLQDVCWTPLLIWIGRKFIKSHLGWSKSFNCLFT